MSNFFQELVDQTKEERSSLYSVPQIQDGIKGNITLETYIAYLTEAYHHGAVAKPNFL